MFEDAGVRVGGGGGTWATRALREGSAIMPYLTCLCLFQMMFEDAGVRVGGYMGHQSPAGGYIMPYLT